MILQVSLKLQHRSTWNFKTIFGQRKCVRWCSIVTSQQIQDGGRPPFWRSLNHNISVKNRPILMKIKQRSGCQYNITCRVRGTTTLQVRVVISAPPLNWYGKTRMVSLPDGEKISKICLFVLTWSTNVTDGQTDTPRDSKDRAYASHRAEKINRGNVFKACLNLITSQFHWFACNVITTCTHGYTDLAYYM